MLNTVVLNKREFRYSVSEKGCWEVQGFEPNTLSNGERGYFLVRFGGNVRHYLHRLSYSEHYGFLSSDMFVCHTCNNKLCINPCHLYLGTPKNNVDDAVRAGAFTHKVCRNGHDLTEPGSTKIVRRSGRNPHNKCVKCERNRKK